MPLRTKWIPFKPTDIRALPQNQSGVYEVGKAEGNIVLYIGKSESCMRSRLLTHKGETKFRGCTHFRRSRTHPDDARLVEKKLQLTYKKQYGKLPPINKIISPGDPYEGLY